MEDPEIVELYWQRSDRAIPETERKYGRYCRTIAGNICGSREDAEECVNDTWFRAWNLMPDKRPAALPPFLGRITRHFAIDRLKAGQRQKRGGGEVPLALEELSDCVPGGTDPALRLELEELKRAVGGFAASLSETEQKVFVARYWYLASIEEIARKMDWSQSRTKSLLFRLRGRLRKKLEEDGLW